MKKKIKKLSLAKETLVNLETALGGAYTYTRLPGGTDTCYCTGFTCGCSDSCQICVPF
jgi:hypothetical protein